MLWYFCPSVLWSFRSSVLLSGIVLWNGSLVFSETQHGVGGLSVVVRDRDEFKKKIIPKIGKMGFIGKFNH